MAGLCINPVTFKQEYPYCQCLNTIKVVLIGKQHGHRI